MWSHAFHCITQQAHKMGEMWDIYCTSTNISVLAEWYRCPEGSVPLTFQASYTKRWQGYECLAQVHICIVILIIRFSSGCYCVPFYESGYKIQTLIPAVPSARFSLLRILMGTHEPITYVIFFLLEALSSIIPTLGSIIVRSTHLCLCIYLWAYYVCRSKRKNNANSILLAITISG